MLHHISFGVSDIQRSATFYDTALAPLGYVRVWADLEGEKCNQAVGYGREGGKDKFAIKQKETSVRAPGPGFHLAFAAPTRDAVDEFYCAALNHGGEGAGGPGLRPQYGENYYAAFVVDPDGYRVEATINEPV